LRFNVILASNFDSVKRLIVFSGAGISAESGIQTFRDAGGLWENYKVEEVATHEAFSRSPELVLEFYNLRRRAIAKVEPNDAHLHLRKLEDKFDVTVITQNIDNLHERAGSSRVLHLHGEITKARGAQGKHEIEDIGYTDIKLGDKATNGSQLRPHIVWFGEDVPEYENAMNIISTANILIVVGTSLNVYPAAGLIHYAPLEAEKYLVDPNILAGDSLQNFEIISKPAGTGIPQLVQRLLG
tara:strand:+ start:37732 stop:38454 length:723 start_codon:yes stop_codon:yes gene_type:complete